MFVGENIAVLGHSRLDRWIEQASPVGKEAPWGAFFFHDFFNFSVSKTQNNLQAHICGLAWAESGNVAVGGVCKAADPMAYQPLPVEQGSDSTVS